MAMQRLQSSFSRIDDSFLIVHERLWLTLLLVLLKQHIYSNFLLPPLINAWLPSNETLPIKLPSLSSKEIAPVVIH